MPPARMLPPTARLNSCALLQTLCADVTMTTHVSADRVQVLSQLCTNWGKPIAAAVYVVGQAQEAAVCEWCDKDTTCACRAANSRLTLSLVHGDRLSESHSSLYPVNTLRNDALDAAKTEFVFGLDADFIVGGDVDALPVPAEKTLYVLPCFRATHERKPGEAWPTTKAELLRWKSEGRVAGYDAPDW